MEAAAHPLISITAVVPDLVSFICFEHKEFTNVLWIERIKMKQVDLYLEGFSVCILTVGHMCLIFH